MSLADQVKVSRQRLQELKKKSPSVFPEWDRLKRAEKQMQIAADELNAAQAAWDRLGEDNN